MELILIAAMDLNRAIGKDNKLLYHLPADMTHFKELTTGNTVVMGRKTFESLPHGALPNRRNIVITKNEDFKAENCEICHSIDEMLKLCKDDKKVYVIGGESLYRQTIDIADRLELTVIMVESNGADRFFPKEDCFEWRNVLYELKRINF
jgi:dihydrofolate reductase